MHACSQAHFLTMLSQPRVAPPPPPRQAQPGDVSAAGAHPLAQFCAQSRPVLCSVSYPVSCPVFCSVACALQSISVAHLSMHSDPGTVPLVSDRYACLLLNLLLALFACLLVCLRACGLAFTMECQDVMLGAMQLDTDTQATTHGTKLACYLSQHVLFP